jgi:drug/metabolite transporter (DMT)-like permease
MNAAEAPAARFAFAALILASLFLAAGPWMVRLADVGPVAAAFWRLALALPFLAFIAWRQARGRPMPDLWLLLAVVAGGLFFAADLAAWHEGILRTKLANATLFGNFASFLFAIYGFILIRTLPRGAQLLALMLAAAGTAMLLGRSYELSPEHLTGDLLAILAGIFYACYLIVVDRARRAMAPFPVLALATAAGALPLLLFALALGEQIVPQDWTPIILLSLFFSREATSTGTKASSNTAPLTASFARVPARKTLRPTATCSRSCGRGCVQHRRMAGRPLALRRRRSDGR